MKQSAAVVRYNLMGFFKNPRVIITFLLAFVLCFLLSSRAMMVAEHFGTPMQALEPFIWTFGDAVSILLCSLLLILLFLDLPKLSQVTPYFLIRMKKRQWLFGQFLYIIIVTGIYIFYILIVTSILCIKKTFSGNIWSKTAALLAFSKMGKHMSVPSTVKVMESTSPYTCMLQIMLLLLCYSLTLAFLILFFQMKTGKKAGAIAALIYSMYGFLLEPQVLAKILRKEQYEMYKINSLTGWISPLNHAVYGVHDFGYDNLPSIPQSCILFVVLLLMLFALSMRILKKYNFNSFTGA